MTVLSRAFYEQEVTAVARSLLGKRLVRRWQGQLLAGIIVETEAYRGEDDLACHAKSGRTPRTAVMYGPAGHAYVYFIARRRCCCGRLTRWMAWMTWPAAAGTTR
jgi:DNA-3-methyladenine glycosylase